MEHGSVYIYCIRYARFKGKVVRMISEKAG